MIESVQKNTRLIFILIADLTIVYSSARSTAAHNSNLGMVCGVFIGATLEREQYNEIITLPEESTDLR